MQELKAKERTNITIHLGDCKFCKVIEENSLKHKHEISPRNKMHLACISCLWHAEKENLIK